MLPTGQMATVCELLKYGDLDITVEDKEGSSALLYAVTEGERRLYQIGEDLFASGHSDIFKELVIWKGSSEWAPLPWAASKGEHCTNLLGFYFQFQATWTVSKRS